jgi:hypothetical protein
MAEQAAERQPRGFLQSFRQKSADAKGAKAHWLQKFYAGAEAPAS